MTVSNALFGNHLNLMKMYDGISEDVCTEKYLKKNEDDEDFKEKVA